MPQSAKKTPAERMVAAIKVHFLIFMQLFHPLGVILQYDLSHKNSRYPKKRNCTLCIHGMGVHVEPSFPPNQQMWEKKKATNQ